MVRPDLRALLRLAAGERARPNAAVDESHTPQSTRESGERAGYDGDKDQEGH
jgi:hypothetical protein